MDGWGDGEARLVEKNQVFISKKMEKLKKNGENLGKKLKKNRKKKSNNFFWTIFSFYLINKIIFLKKYSVFSSSSVSRP